MSVGVLAHLFGSLPSHQLAAKVGSYGFRHVQLALWKAIGDVDFGRPGVLSPGLAQSVAEEFDKHNVSIATLGCYLHLYDRDEEKRRRNVARFKELLRYARLFGCSVVCAESGINPGLEYTDRDWSAFRTTLEELTEEAAKWGVFVGIEPANTHLIDTAPALYRLLEEVPSSNVGVVLDPGNLLNEANWDRQDEVIEEAFRLLGTRIVAAHAKDLKLAENGQLQVVAPGQGQMNYALFGKLLNEYKPRVQIIMEAAQEHEMLAAKSYIESHLRG